MPKGLTEDDLFHIFAAECRGNTLIIAPRGDAAGFPESQFRRAVQRLHEQFAKCRSRHLIIDLETIGYPGMTMLTAVQDLVMAVRRRGGLAAVVGCSAETMPILREYGLGEDWTVYPDLGSAVREIVREPVRGRMWRRRKLLGAVAAVVLVPLVAVLAYLAVNRTPEGAAYRELSKVWGEYRQLRLLPFEDERVRRASSLAERARGIEKESERKRLWAAAASARKLREIVLSPVQPHPQAEAFGRTLAAHLRATDASEDLLAATGARRLLNFSE